MANRHDKKRQLDDEMSRFEAEISGPPDASSAKRLQPPPPPPPTVIGANTFTQVQQRLQQKHPGSPGQPRPPPPPGPPGGPPRPPVGPHGPLPPVPRGPNSNGLGVLPPPPPPPPGYIGPRIPGGSDGNMGPTPLRPPPPPPGFIPPQLNRHHMNNNMMNDGPPMNHMMGSGGGPPGFMRPPRPPPGHMGPPGFIGPHGPPQGMGGHHMPPAPRPMSGGPGPGFGPGGPNQSGPPVGPHMPPGPPGMLRGPHPPPPPPSVLSAQAQMGPVVAGAPFVPAVVKPPTVISSAPKIYTAQPTKTDGTKVELVASPIVNATLGIPDISLEPKKKKLKGEQVMQPSQLMTHAQEMAEKVRASTVTTTLRPEGGPTPQEEKKKEGKSNRKNKILRSGGGQVWEDQSLSEWDADDFRIFCGDLGNDVTDELLTRYFSHFSSFVKAKVVRDKRTNKSKGYGFISFSDPQDYIRAMKEMNGKYVGSRPIKLRKSMWKDRNLDVVQKKQREKQLLGLK
ncbi:RNA-binding protein 42 [Halocaridina rubra]|uniref:RNA-binding protein 42 n=2 Tax=Halocaridina rubra TaxID=373956 RepID=A0AAN9A8X3_HALRR